MGDRRGGWHGRHSACCPSRNSTQPNSLARVDQRDQRTHGDRHHGRQRLLRETCLPDPIKRLNKLFACALCGGDQPGPRFSTCACHKICSGCAKGKDLPFRAVATRHADKKLCPVSACRNSSRRRSRTSSSRRSSHRPTRRSTACQPGPRRRGARRGAHRRARRSRPRGGALAQRFRECEEEDGDQGHPPRSSARGARQGARRLQGRQDRRHDAKLIGLMGGEDPQGVAAGRGPRRRRRRTISSSRPRTRPRMRVGR